MRAVILAAGIGRRLASSIQDPLPKCLLSFDGTTLLERHLRILRACGIDEVVLVVGFEQQQIVAELDRLDWQPRPTLVFNSDYHLGSVLSVQVAAEALTAGGDVLLMDADVLYDRRLLEPLCGAGSFSRLAFDTGFEPGEEPVKLCLANGSPVELRKRVADGLVYDRIGESIGFFRFSQADARRLSVLVQGYIDQGRAAEPHEEAVRDLLLEAPSSRFETADVTGAPWLEIDFPADVERARHSIFPKLQPSW
jgi:choline kinase